MKIKTFDLKLYVITDRYLVGRKSLIDVVKQAIEGGASVIQLRDKNIDDEAMITLGKNIMVLTKGKIPLIVNDRVNVALAIGAQGIHVGQDDIPARQVKKIIGNSMMLGVSANTVSEAKKAELDGADYIGAGPVFQTSTKLDADPVIGLHGLRKIKESVSIPVVGIGGINAKNAKDVIKIADGIAVVSAVMAAKDPKKATQNLSEIIKKYHEQR